jgi:hypothetical protein
LTVYAGYNPAVLKEQDVWRDDVTDNRLQRKEWTGRNGQTNEVPFRLGRAPGRSHTYAWRVRLHDGERWGPWSQWQRFTSNQIPYSPRELNVKDPKPDERAGQVIPAKPRPQGQNIEVIQCRVKGAGSGLRSGRPVVGCIYTENLIFGATETGGLLSYDGQNLRWSYNVIYDCSGHGGVHWYRSAHCEFYNNTVLACTTGLKGVLWSVGALVRNNLFADCGHGMQASPTTYAQPDLDHNCFFKIKEKQMGCFHWTGDTKATAEEEQLVHLLLRQRQPDRQREDPRRRPFLARAAGAKRRWSVRPGADLGLSCYAGSRAGRPCGRLLAPVQIFRQ